MTFTAGAAAGDPATVSAAEIAAAFGTVKSDASADDASFIADYSVEDANGNLVTSTLPFDDVSLDVSDVADGSTIFVVTRVTDAAGNIAYTDDVTLATQDGTVGAAADIVFDSVDPEFDPIDGVAELV